MYFTNIDLAHSFNKGRRTLLFVEKEYFVLAAATFTGTDILIEHLEKHSLKNGISENNVEAGFAEIIERVKSRKTLPPKIVLSLPSFLFEVNIFALPKTKDTYVDLFVRDKLNTSKRKLYYRYSILGETGEKGSLTLTVLACSIPTSYVNDVYFQFEKAGLRILCMSHPTIGLIQLLNADLKKKPDDLLILVDTISKPISVCVYAAGRLSQLRILHNIDCEDRGGFVRDLTLEMKRTVLYCKQTHAGKIVDKIIYLGEKTSECDSVFDEISMIISLPMSGIDLEKINYRSGVEGDSGLERYLPSLCGLHLMDAGLMRFMEGRNKFNFISSHSKAKALVGLLIALLLFVSAFVISINSKLNGRITDFESNLAELETKKSRFGDIDKKDNEIEFLDRSYSDYRKIMGDLETGAINLSALVLLIIECLPESSHIVSITLKEGKDEGEAIRTFIAVIRDDFTGKSSLPLEESIGRLKKTGFFTKVEYQLLGSSVKTPADNALEEAKVEIRF